MPNSYPLNKHKSVDSQQQNSDNPHMDWKSLIADIRAKGLSQIEIGRRIGRSQAWVAALVAGKYKDVGWSDGEAIRALHAEIAAVNPENRPISENR